MMRTERVLKLRVSDIRPNPYQPRRAFDEEGLRELASSIRRHGILQPLTVRPAGGGKWELVAGERRLRAARMAGLETVPCIRRAADDREAALLALVENLQRRDLHYLEEAAAIASYIRQTGVTQEEAAAQLGRSPSALANKLRLLRLSPDCRELLVKHGLTERHARCLLRLEDETYRGQAAERSPGGAVHRAAALCPSIHPAQTAADIYPQRRTAVSEQSRPGTAAGAGGRRGRPNGAPGDGGRHPADHPYPKAAAGRLIFSCCYWIVMLFSDILC